MIKRLAIISLLSFSLFSCSKAIDKQYNEATLEQDIKEISSTNDLTPEEAQTFGQYVIGSKLRGESLSGKTYKQILEDAKSFKIKQQKEQEEQNRLAEEARKLEAEKIAKLKKSVSLVIFDKSIKKINYSDRFIFKTILENKSNKDIKAFKGKVIFNDLFDQTLYNLDFTYDEGLKVNQHLKGLKRKIPRLRI